MKMTRISMALALLTLLAGCTTYYEVTDPTTGKVYYTTHIDKSKDGSVELTVAESDTEVTIQNSEIRKISKQEFKDAAYKPAAPVEAVPAATAQ